MCSPELKNIVCRICLDGNVAFDWNNALIEHSDLSYKDCYYKYTQLEQLGDNDPLSSMLCKSCSNGLEDVHSLIMKALDSYNFLLEVNGLKVNTEASIVEGDDKKCTSADFETVLVEKPDPQSAVLQQFEYESFDESSIKSEDDFTIYEGIDDMQYQEMFGIENQEEFVRSHENVEEDMPKMYEKRKSERIFCKRKLTDDSNTKIDSKTSRISYSRHKGGRQSMDIEKNEHRSLDDRSTSRDSEKMYDYLNIEKLQYEDILEEYEDSHETDHDHTDEEILTGNEGSGNSSQGVMPTKINLENGGDRNNKTNLKKSATLNTRHKKGSQNSKLQGDSDDYKIKNSNEPKRNKVKTKKSNHLNSQNTPRMCSYCSKILHNKYALQKHEKIHLENRERKAPCPICGVKFLEESYVKIHMQIHNQNRVKKHQCEFCDKAFYEKGSLNVHRRIHLGQMIPCTLCSKEFFRQVDLDIHMNSHSAAVINAETKKRSRYWVRCKYCHKDIMSTSFKYHMAVHLKEPQMRCSICDREFFRRDNCTDHLRTVHKKTTEEYSNFIILYNKNRLSHLYLEQTTELKK